MFDLDDILRLAPVVLVVLVAALRWLRRVQRGGNEIPQPSSGDVVRTRPSRRDEIDFERDYEPLEPR